jgi:hypothetical protein
VQSTKKPLMTIIGALKAGGMIFSPHMMKIALEKRLRVVEVPITFRKRVYQIPTSMLQNTVSKAYCADTISALQWFRDNIGSSGVLLTHRAFYGWVMLTVNPDQIVLYEYDNPANTAKTVAQQGQSKT